MKNTLYLENFNKSTYKTYFRAVRINCKKQVIKNLFKLEVLLINLILYK